MSRLEGCVFSKTVLMIFVILGHCADFWTGKWFTVLPVAEKNTALLVFAEWTNSFHIYAFTLISGYIFYAMRFENNKYGRYAPFILNKIKRLIIPYFFVGLLYVAPITSVFYGYSLKEVFFNFVLACGPGQLWFLWMLFWVFVIFWPLAELLNSNSYIGIIICIMSYGVGLIGSSVLPNYYCIWTSFQYLWFFWIGFELRKRRDVVLWKIPIVVFVVVGAVSFAIKYYINFDDIGKYIYELMLHTVGAIGAFFILQNMALTIKKRKRIRSYHFYQNIQCQYICCINKLFILY